MTERELLSKLWGHLSMAKKVEPYKVWRHVEFEALLKVRPKTIEELSQIKGFPRDGVRVRNYGQSIIDIFNRPTEIEDFSVSLDKDGEPCSSTELKSLDLF